MTETTASETAQAAAAAPAPAPVESGLASRVAALEADVSSFKGRVVLLEGKLETWVVKHAAVIAGTSGFLAGIGFTLLAVHKHL